MTMEMNRIGSIWNGITGHGIFTYLDHFDVPWKSLDIASHLDILYHGNHGFRITSPLVDAFANDGNLSDYNKMKIAHSIYAQFSQNWSKIWEALAAEYDPIVNYDMREEFKETEEGKVIDTNKKTGDDVSGVDSGKLTTKVSAETKVNPGTVENKLSGFNSSGYVNGSEVIEGQTVTSLDPDKNLTEVTDTRKTKTDYNSQLQNTRTYEDYMKSHVLTRKGNIGVMTAQDAQLKSLEVWSYNFFEHVMNDIDSVLTINMY